MAFGKPNSKPIGIARHCSTHFTNALATTLLRREVQKLRLAGVSEPPKTVQLTKEGVETAA